MIIGDADALALGVGGAAGALRRPVLGAWVLIKLVLRFLLLVIELLVVTSSAHASLCGLKGDRNRALAALIRGLRERAMASSKLESQGAQGDPWQRERSGTCQH